MKGGLYGIPWDKNYFKVFNSTLDNGTSLTCAYYDKNNTITP